MSTKTSKKSSAAAMSTTNMSNVTSPPAGTSTPIPQRPRSPLSPTRHSRLQEKHDLQNLNDRLAYYIENVRHLETENLRLTLETQTMQETSTREVTNIKSMYELELSDTRKLLDDTARERAKLEIDTRRLWDDNETLKTKLEKKIKELQTAEGNSLIYESRYNDLQLQNNQFLAERKKLLEREREHEEEAEKLKAALDDARKHLGEETLQRIDLENTIQSLKEDITFKNQVHEQQLTETRTRRQIEITEIDGRLAKQYEDKFQQSFKELREQCEAQIRANREEIELLYENKINNLTSHAQRNVGTASLAVEELRQTRIKIEGLHQKINELEATNNGLNARIRELENSREAERSRQAENLAALEGEVERMRNGMNHQLKEYQDLMDIKVALDSEIAAYRTLLESEEARLNITPVQSTNKQTSYSRSTPSRNTPLKGSKRKRTLLEESEESSSTDYNVTGIARGDIEITEADPQGRFVKLTNKGSKEISLSGWQLIRKVGTSETLYKFHRTTKIDAGATIMVWSADTGAVHEPPSNLVMKGQKWFTGDTMTTTLINLEGVEMATSERKQQRLSSSLSRHRDALGTGRSTEELHHQQGDPPGQETCRIM